MSQPPTQPLRVPTAVLEASGALKRNPSRAARRIGEIEYPPMDFTRPPAHLDDDAVRVWREMARVFDGLDVVSSADSSLLALAAKTLAELRRAEAVIAAEGMTVDGPTGLKAHPLLSHVRALRQQSKGLLAEMGWTPVSRSKVTARSAPEEEENEFGDLLE
jgi:P27 family predicted phage terminase small subunit